MCPYVSYVVQKYGSKNIQTYTSYNNNDFLSGRVIRFTTLLNVKRQLPKIRKLPIDI